MRYTNEDIRRFLNYVDPMELIPLIEERIQAEKINLQVNQILNDKHACIAIEHRIADAEILILILRGWYLPS
jgi:hypothetical protein